MLDQIKSDVEKLVKQIEKVQKVEELVTSGNAKLSDIEEVAVEMTVIKSNVNNLILQYLEKLGTRIRREKILEELGYGKPIQHNTSS